MKIHKHRIKLLVILSLLLVLATSYVIITAFSGRAIQARRNWKNAAINEITRFSNNKEWLKKEIALINSSKKKSNVEFEVWWVSDRLILLKNGEWLIYKNHCSKRVPHNVSDIFIAKGSDKKWYYSTYHFCIDMFVLKHMNEYGQSKDIKEFMKRYSLKTFDGKSDVCLQKTWPPLSQNSD